MPAIITDTFDYNDIVRVLDLDEAFVHHQIDALQPKYWRVMIKTKPKGLKIFPPVMVSGNRGIDYMIYMLSRNWFVTYDMLRGEQVEKSENQNRAAKVQEEEGLRNCKELVDRLVRRGMHL